MQQIASYKRPELASFETFKSCEFLTWGFVGRKTWNAAKRIVQTLITRDLLQKRAFSMTEKEMRRVFRGDMRDGRRRKEPV